MGHLCASADAIGLVLSVDLFIVFCFRSDPTMSIFTFKLYIFFKSFGKAFNLECYIFFWQNPTCVFFTCNDIYAPYLIGWNCHINHISSFNFRKMSTHQRQRLLWKNSRWMDVILEMSGDFLDCSSCWIVASLLFDMLNSDWLKDTLRLKAFTEFWDTDGGGWNRLPWERNDFLDNLSCYFLCYFYILSLLW